MGQKVNPISLRLQQTNREFDNRWYTDYFYKKLLSRDIYLQQYINSFLKLIKLPSARFSIQYSTKKITLSSFLCYPKQSREIRSRMLGITLPSSFYKKKSNRKGNNKLKKKLNHSFLLNKKNTPLFFENKKKKNAIKTIKFLLDHRLWSRIYTPFNTFRKNNETLFFINKKNKTTLSKNTKQISNDFFLPFIFKEFSNLKNLEQKVFYVPFNCFLLDKKQQNRKQRQYQKENNSFSFLHSKKETYFIKNFITTLFFIKILNTQSFLLCKKEYQKKANKNFLNNLKKLEIQYRKHFFKFFLIFYLLYTEYNKNTVYSSNYFIKNNKHLNIQKIINQLYCFSFSQPISNFHTILQNKTPINFLLEHNGILFNDFINFLQIKKESKKSVNSIQKNFLQTSPFFEVVTKKNAKILQQLKYKNYIQYFLSSQFNINTEFLPFGVSQDWQSAGFLADEIVYFLERRVTFRRLKHKIIKKIAENSNIRGVRISCSGRVGGKSKKAQRAKTECVKYGQTSRHTFSSRIDFAVRTARTSFGSVGIKVWICYN